MRYSQQRELIYDAIRAVNSHPNAQEILKMVQPYVPNISIGTLYRNLRQLVKNQMIQELNVHGVSHFDGNVNDHQHFSCIECHSIFDFTFNSKALINKFNENKHHHIQECKIMFSGVCHDCNSIKQ